MAHNAKLYTYRVRWSEEDEEFLATVAEFPSLSWLEEDQEAAFSGIVDLVEEVICDMKAAGELVPEPMSTRNYSGSVRLRIPPEQHRDLTIQAAEEGVSLNRLLCSLISMPRHVVAAVLDDDKEAHHVSQPQKAVRSKSTTFLVKADPSDRTTEFSVVQGGKSASAESRFKSVEPLYDFDVEEM